MKIKLVICILLLIMLNNFIFSESLWNDSASNVYSFKTNYKIGDTIQIQIDEASSIDYKSTNKSIKDYNIDVSGGEMTAVLNFFPKGSVQTGINSQNKDDVKIKSVLQGRITAINGNILSISGQKTITVDNKSSSVQISGEASINDIVGKAILSHKLVNSQISMSTLIDNKSVILTDKDVEKILLNPDATNDKNKQYENRITDVKKKQLLLEYFNKILNVVF